MRGRLIIGLIALPIALGAAAWTPPRTPWGDPDLQGIWTYATMTPLERPRDLASKPVLTADEAAAYERRPLRVRPRPTTPPAPTGGTRERARSSTAARR